jgi:hypothetical protein
LKNENEKLKNENEKLKNDYNSLKENYGKLNNEIKKSNLYNESDNKNKDLLTNVEDKKPKEYLFTEELKIKFFEFLKYNVKNNNEKKFNLLYKASEDGNDANNFHGKIDGKKPLVIIVQTENGQKFLFFTSKSWSNNRNKIVYDSEAFYFSNFKLNSFKNILSGCEHKKNSGFIFFIENYDNYYKYNYKYFYINCNAKLNNSKINDYEVYLFLN